MAIVIIITASLILFDEHTPMTPITDVDVLQHRQEQYREHIDSILRQKLDHEMCIIITENNGVRPTCLDQFCDEYPNVHVHYTDNQFLTNSCNKGRKELLDIQSACRVYHIPEDTLVVKITGRYKLVHDQFLTKTREDEDKYDVFYRQGSMFKPLESMQERDSSDCVTGLIALRCHFFMNIMKVEDVQEYVPIEWLYAKNIHKHIPAPRQYVCDTVGFQNEGVVL